MPPIFKRSIPTPRKIWIQGQHCRRMLIHKENSTWSNPRRSSNRELPNISSLTARYTTVWRNPSYQIRSTTSWNTILYMFIGWTIQFPSPKIIHISQPNLMTKLLRRLTLQTPRNDRHPYRSTLTLKRIAKHLH